MKNLLLTFGFLFTANVVVAQYTNVINSRRPGYSESPFGVGMGVYQAEAGIFYQKSDEENWGSLQKSLGTDVFLRTGLLEKLEINLSVKFQKDNYLEQLEPYTTRKTGGVSQFTLGTKYMIYMPTYKDPSKEIRSWRKKWEFDKRRLIPSVGIAAGFNPNLLSKEYKMPGMSLRAAVLLQHDFSDYLIWVNNAVVENANLTELRAYGYISTLTYSVTDRFSVFGEQQGLFRKDVKDFKLTGGVAYLFSKDLQVGLNLQWDMKLDHNNYFGGIGASWRLDKHVEKSADSKSKKDGSGRIQNKKKGIKDIFSKKKKRR